MILLTLSNYLVAKFLLLPPEKVLQILEHLTINGIEVPGFRNEPQGGNILGHFAQLVQCLSEQNFDAAFLSLRETLEAYTQLIETGNLPLATATMQGLAGWLVSQKFRVSDVANVIIATVMRGERNELPEFGHIGRVNLFGQTDGAFQEAAHWFVQHKRPPKKMQTSENAFSLVDQNERAVALSTVKTDGYYVFQNTVAPDLCRDLCQWARTAPAQAVFPYSGDTPMAPVDLNRDDVDGYNINLQSAMETPEVQRILCQSPLPSLAQDHLGCAPILANVAMRWVLPSDRENSNDLAQLFHWDAGWTRWINFFIYLTDVDETAGPHAYVPKTHRRGAKPARFLARGYARIPDPEIHLEYGAENVTPILGPSGSVIMGDTRCWHKGVHPTKKPRLTLQIIFADTLTAGPRLPLTTLRKEFCLPEFREFIERQPHLFQQEFYRVI